MLIRVLLEDGEEGLFNADCRVAHLLDAIKKRLKVPRSDTIDLCTPEGEVKELHYHNDNNAANFFTLRELCLAVQVQERDSTAPYFTPVLSEYASNKEFLYSTAVLNAAEDVNADSVHGKSKHPSPSGRTHRGMSVAASKAGKQTAIKGRKTARRCSAMKT